MMVGGAHPTRHTAFTLVEMLVAMAITLVMMAAVVTLFANVSNSVRNRRATIEMSGQVRHLRNVLQQDLQGATCPGLTWQRPESNHGYIEIIEGSYRDSFPSILTDGIEDSDDDGNDPDGDSLQTPDELDPEQSLVPTANDGTYVQKNGVNTISTANGLGDHDDILMLTVRNESEPFVGRMPRVLDSNGQLLGFANWTSDPGESPLAEVVWFAVENPNTDQDADGFFGEPGFRTIYRRTLLIAPWLNPYRYQDNNGNVIDTFQDGGKTFKAEPGLVRLLRDDVELTDVAQALAALTAFQDRYDLSVRLEWDHNIGGPNNPGRWKIMANTLGDLTKRENRFAHYGYHFQTGAGKSERVFPYAVASTGRNYSGGSGQVTFVVDPEINRPSDDAQATANFRNIGAPLEKIVASYTNDPPNLSDATRRYTVRPFAYVGEPSKASATALVMLNDDGAVVRVLPGLVPLWGSRRGEDVMMTDALAFDLRVYDPGAPLYQESTTETIVEPSDPGWQIAYKADMLTATDFIGDGGFIGQGAYVDLGYSNPYPLPRVAPGASWSVPWFAEARALTDVFGNQLAPGYAVYDTWSFHYENNGRDDDGDTSIDEGTNGLDDIGNYIDPITKKYFQETRLGIDDVGERESVPPYDKPLRGVQALVRVYERDSRAIRQVRVNQHFMPE
jgi:prepilin-type N-terminal cleavage/methylation domain-containing protein